MVKENTKEDVLQAILIADNFSKHFLPLPVSMSLMPVNGSTYLDYALEFLSRTDVKEVFVVTSKQSDLIKSHINDNWKSSDVPFQIIVFASNECRSFGDAMRDVDKKGVIKSDFILLQVGVICNSNFKAVVQEHKARRLKDNKNVMTVVYAEASPNHPMRIRNRDVYLAVQTSTNRLLASQPVVEASNSFSVPLSVYIEHENVSARFDLLDCNLAICSHQIPPLFSDNFDFETRRDLIKEILTNDEILQYQMHVHVLSESNAMFVDDYNSLLKANQFVMERYFSPLAPDCILLKSDRAGFNWFKRNIYLHKDKPSIAKTAKLIRNATIGNNCKIGDDVVLENVSLGDNCTIGRGSVLKNCILFSDVFIGSWCDIECSLVCSNVKVGNSSKLKGRNVLLPKVSLKPEAVVDVGFILCQTTPIVGELLKTVLFDNDGGINQVEWKTGALWPKWQDCDLVDVYDAEDFADVANHNAPDDELANSEDSGSESDEPVDSFFDTVLDILKSGLENSGDCANMVLEINCAKPSYNVGLEELNHTLFSAILELAKTTKCLNNFNELLQKLLPLLRNYFKTEKSQEQCLSALQDFCSSNPDFAKQLVKVLHFLYDKDVLTEDVILKWHSKLETDLAAKISKFIEWLEQSDDEDSDDES